jgi:hypothetical protein
LIQIHNKSTYTRLYNELSAVFIDSFCKFKNKKNNTNESFLAAKINVQDKVVDMLNKKNANIQIIIKAYSDVINDTNLIRKAIKFYKEQKV